MPRDPQEFVRFLTAHYRPIEAMCRQRRRFASDSELLAFLRPFEADDKNLAPLIGLMRSKGILIELAGEWCPPPFLTSFIDQLSLRHVLASPKVIRGWVETLDGHVETLLRRIGGGAPGFGSSAADDLESIIRDIDETFQNIVRTVQDNCDRIAAEVGEYRRSEEAGQIRSRLNRLIKIHDDFLEPVIQIIEVGGEFYSVTEKVRNCCLRIASHARTDKSLLNEHVIILQREVTWLRRVVVRGAEEARRELAPLCEAAARESQIARGVNRTLDAILQGDWASVSLETNLSLLVDKDTAAFADQAIRQFLADVHALKDQPAPTVPVAPSESLPLPITADDLLDRLQHIEAEPDLLDWVLELYDDLSLGDALRLFHTLISREPSRVSHSDEINQYCRDAFAVEAPKWAWKGPDNGASDAKPDSRPPARKSRERLSVP